MMIFSYQRIQKLGNFLSTYVLFLFVFSRTIDTIFRFKLNRHENSCTKQEFYPIQMSL